MNVTKWIKTSVVLAIVALGAAVGLAGEDARLSNWRPGGDTSGVRYIGSNACAECHAQQAESYFATPMARAAALASDSELLVKNPRLTFREGRYGYEIKRQGNRSVYTVGDGTRTISEPILYTFGSGVAGQTYIFRHDGSFYESRVSYFRKRGGLDLTILHPRAEPSSLEEAIGRRMSPEGAQGCFNCHTTGAVDGAKFQLDRLVPGIACEACHGPGERHVAAVKTKEPRDPQIFNPGTLDAIDLTQEFCGSCHMSFEKVMTMPDHGGLNNIRFQPYRAFRSRGHLVDDRGLSCVACHDPHDKLEHEPAFYDAKCLACHLSSPTEVKTLERSESACPVGATNCVTCHMPKVELPEMHFTFTDHWIRIAKPGGPVPN